MESTAIPIAIKEILGALGRQAGHFTNEQLAELLGSLVRGGSGGSGGSGFLKCSIKENQNGVVLVVGSGDYVELFGKLVCTGGCPLPEKKRAFRSICGEIGNRLERSKTEEGQARGGSTHKDEITIFLGGKVDGFFQMEFGQFSRDLLISLKKKVLGAMLGEKNDRVEKGRPPVGRVRCENGGAVLTLGSEQACHLLKKNIRRLNAKQLVSLDNRLSAAITTLPHGEEKDSADPKP